MRDNALTLGTIGGIRIRLHWSWSIIFLLLTWTLADRSQACTLPMR
jgi:hypothetical protein